MLDRQTFKHTTQLRVRNYEVDWQGIVHNGNYLLYCEVGRVDYLKHIGARIDLNSINSESRVVLVRNEIDYLAPAMFDDLLTVCTRVSFIKNSSFAMEGIIERASSRERIVENVAYHVWLDPITKKSKSVPDDMRRLVQSFEGSNCAIEWPSLEI
jgi:acyl-CoA thioester hydrolase